LPGAAGAAGRELKPWSGGATPPLALRDTQGREHKLSDYRGKKAVVLADRALLAPEDVGLTEEMLPETMPLAQAGDVSAYIPTNVISITDGQIYLESDLFFAGVRPAVNAGISVSRVGGNAQIKAMKAVAGRLRLDLAQYRELEAFSAFAGDLDAATKKQLERGARTVEALKQGQYEPMPVEQQVMTIFAVTNGYLDDVETGTIRAWEAGFHAFMKARVPQVGDKIRSEKVISKDTEAELRRGLEEYKKLATTGAEQFTAASL